MKGRLSEIDREQPEGMMERRTPTGAVNRRVHDQPLLRQFRKDSSTSPGTQPEVPWQNPAIKSSSRTKIGQRELTKNRPICQAKAQRQSTGSIIQLREPASPSQVLLSFPNAIRLVVVFPFSAGPAVSEWPIPLTSSTGSYLLQFRAGQLEHELSHELSRELSKHTRI